MTILKKCDVCHENVGAARPYVSMVCGHTLCFFCNLRIAATSVYECPVCLESLEADFLFYCHECGEKIYLMDPVCDPDGTTYHRHCFRREETTTTTTTRAPKRPHQERDGPQAKRIQAGTSD